MARRATRAPWGLVALQTLNAELLSHDSATLTVDRWCATHGIDTRATILAERRYDVNKPATAEIRARLRISSDIRSVIVTSGFGAANISCRKRITGTYPLGLRLR